MKGSRSTHIPVRNAPIVNKSLTNTSSHSITSTSHKIHQTTSHPNRIQSRSLSATAENTKLFDKILVANRGEIACRIFRTCNKLGIKTVAVYSEADENAQHVKLADEAICIGPSQALDSYLRPERILEAAKRTGANAVHPGYGFLSENADFAKVLEENGITFIGPKADTIREMGNKIRSKEIAESVNVKPIPGFVGSVRDEEHLLEVANRIGYPVMVKAAHGGGGKGMRRANNDEECREGYRLSLAEAKTAFNSSTMLVEKFIENPRHIEFQVLADAHGNAVYVHERECSVQRRNQKLVEEAPSTFLTPEQRERIGNEAVAIAKVSKYQNAGTVEFLMGSDGQHYYLEMNTRLQVEHPITEMISGLDLVEQQIRVAAGHPLKMKQDDIKINGWSVEARVCAEDPVNNFLPSVGTLTRFKTQNDLARVDQGFIEGDNISIYYDSLLAKVITHAPTRKVALEKMADALDGTVIHGLAHNICFLREVMEHPQFVKGDLTTNFIAEHFPDGFTGHKVNQIELDTLISAAVSVNVSKALGRISFTGKDAAKCEPLIDLISESVISTTINGKQRYFHVDARHVDEVGNYCIVTTELDRLDQLPADSKHRPRMIPYTSDYNPSKIVFKVTNSIAKEDGDSDSDATAQSASDSESDGGFSNVDSIVQTLKVNHDASNVSLLFKGSPYAFDFFKPKEAALFKHMPEKPQIDLSKTILSPMPGQIYSVNVKPGDVVSAGQELLVVEAMKMQNSLKALKTGTVKAVHVNKGDTVSGDQLLVEIE